MDYKCKSGLLFKGKSFMEIMLEKIKDFDEKMIVAKAQNAFSFEDVKVLEDVIPNRGPLCGLYTALVNSRNDRVLVLAVDTIFISKELIDYLVSLSKGFDAVIPRDGCYYQPLCAVYAKSCLPLIRESITRGVTKPIDLFESWNVRYVSRQEVEQFGDYEVLFKNINTTEEYLDIL